MREGGTKTHQNITKNKTLGYFGANIMREGKKRCLSQCFLQISKNLMRAFKTPVLNRYCFGIIE